jgi:hypothetical protein
MSVKYFCIVALCRQIQGLAGTARCRNRHRSRAARRCATTSGALGRISAGSRRGTSHGLSRGCRQRFIVPSARTISRNFTPDLRSAHIAARAERHSHPSSPAVRIASRALPRRCHRRRQHQPECDDLIVVGCLLLKMKKRWRAARSKRVAESDP